MFYFLLFFCISCNRNENYLYLNKFSGVALYSGKSSGSPVITYIPYGHKLKLLKNEKLLNKTKSGGSITDLYHITFNNHTGWIFEKPSKSKPDMNLYYKVVTGSGLFLRKEPSVNAKAILLIPYLSKDKVLKISNVWHKIGNKIAFWANVRYKNYTGWIFTAFVEIQSLESLNNKDFHEWSYYDDFKFDELNKYEKISDLSSYNVKTHNYNNFQITICSPKKHNIGNNILLLFKNLKTNKTFYSDKYSIIHKIQFNYPLENSVLMRVNSCSSCDEYEFNEVFLLEDNSIKHFSFESTKFNSFCQNNFGMYDPTNNYRINKTDTEKTSLYIYKKHVSCNDNSIKSPLICCEDNSYYNNKYFNNEIFIVIKNVNGKFTSNFIVDSGVMKEYDKEWSSSKILK